MTKLTHTFRAIRASVANERGFTMIPAMMAVLVGSLISLGAWSAANADITLQNTDRYTKLAYSQAESGVSDYVQQMAEDAGYWQFCDEPPGPAGTPLGIGQTAINDTDKSGVTGATARRWLPQPTIGSTADAALTQQYTIDLIPANGTPSCKSKPNRNESMVDKSTGVIRIRVTGRAGPAVPAGQNIVNWRNLKWKRRSIVIEFRRKGFLDYAYFTDKEGVDPGLQDAPESTNCIPYYTPLPGTANNTARFYWNGLTGRGNGCMELRFFNTDKVNGPFHSNDGVLIESNGGPDFGNPGKNDVTEVFDGACPFRVPGGSANDHAIPNGVTDTATGNAGTNKCTNTPGSIKPTLYGPLRIGAAAGYLPLPESNQDLRLYASSDVSDPYYNGYYYEGKTTITLKTGGKMTVVNNGVTQTDIDYPPSGVIYVGDSPSAANCKFEESKFYDSPTDPMLPIGCGLAEVKGTYDEPLTITSDSDVVITGDVRRLTTASTAVLGLIGNNYVRVRHYAAANTCGNIANTSANTPINYIDAAILTLHHSFIFDRADCGSSMGTLHLSGVLAQAYRGLVKSGGGYAKDYNYDYRYKYLTPPHFLVPTLSTWRISRYREQTPSCVCA